MSTHSITTDNTMNHIPSSKMLLKPVKEILAPPMDTTTKKVIEKNIYILIITE